MACKLQHIDGQSVTVTRSVTVKDELTWCVHVHGQTLDPSKCSALKDFPVANYKYKSSSQSIAEIG